MAGITQSLIRVLQKLAPSSREPAHLRLGRRGETEAHFYLKRLGYRFVAANFRVPHDRGEIDLIGWDEGVLCFIEVKTRMDDSFAPPSTAVTIKKQRNIIAVAKAYLRRLPGERPPCRFDIVSVVPSDNGGEPQFTLRKGAFSWDAGSAHGRREYREYSDNRHYPPRR